MELVTIDELIQAQTHIWKHTYQFIKSLSLKCAVQLGIPDIIHSRGGQPMTLAVLVAALQIHPSKTHHVYRLMRVLVHSGFFSLQTISDDHQSQEGYLLTPASRLLLKDNPFDLRSFISLVLDPSIIEPHNHMYTWFQNDDATPFVTAFGETLFERAGHVDGINRVFNEAMANDSSLIGKVAMVKCREVFEGLDSLVNLAGGTGNMAKAIAETFPNIKCIVMDLPHVIADLQDSKNLNFVEGDMFNYVPPADAILLKWILHDWPDEDCVKILRNCREAITTRYGKGGKVIIIDVVMGNQTLDGDMKEVQLLFDMQMMVCMVGKERNEKEWAKLFFDAGFTNYKTNHILGSRSLIEVYP